MRMSDLAERRLMSSGGLTRLVDRLEARGLLERRRSAADGRGLAVSLTREGRALIRRAQQQHDRHVRALFSARLREDDLRRLGRPRGRCRLRPCHDHGRVRRLDGPGAPNLRGVRPADRGGGGHGATAPAVVESAPPRGRPSPALTSPGSVPSL
ncbi:MarR family winged helix-turn-helix transcriptional regulator [Actinokineospora sp. G85]|uniref:MarR family winged helix-turn-helix transcriptional regulator n=1 Tax=Actinokineospora sp. G85 TaxID=3406626 RepID=UPI003C747CD6